MSPSQAAGTGAGVLMLVVCLVLGGFSDAVGSVACHLLLQWHQHVNASSQLIHLKRNLLVLCSESLNHILLQEFHHRSQDIQQTRVLLLMIQTLHDLIYQNPSNHGTIP